MPQKIIGAHFSVNTTYEQKVFDFDCVTLYIENNNNNDNILIMNKNILTLSKCNFFPKLKTDQSFQRILIWVILRI